MNLHRTLPLLLIISFFSCSSAQEPNPEPVVEKMEPNLISVRKYLVDKQATTETAALFYNLKRVSEKRYLIGVHENPSICMTATSLPEAMYGTDYLFITDIIKNPGSWYQNKQVEIRNNIKLYYSEGQVVTMCWHLRNPIENEPANFYWKDLIVAKPDIQNIVPRLLPGGSQYERFKLYLDEVAKFANTLIDDNGRKIPIIFRPWHEQDGDWFWWGKGHCSRDEYVALWRFTVTYLRDVKGIHHFLYVYSPGGDSNVAIYLDWYPGDEYVDILGCDHYLQDKSDIVSKPKGKLTTISALAIERNKVAAMTETGYSTNEYPVKATIFTDYFASIVGDSQIAYLMIWSGDHYIPSQTYMNFSSYIRSQRLYHGWNVPKMFQFP